MAIQYDVYVDFVRSYVEVVKSLSYCYKKLIVSTAQTKPLTTNILNDYWLVWLLQHLQVSTHLVWPKLAYYLLLLDTTRLVSMVVERSVELYTYWIDIAHNNKNIFRNFNSAKYTFSKFCIPQSTLRKVHLPMQ